MKKPLTIIKNILLFIALWVFTFSLFGDYNYGDGFKVLIQSLAVAVLIVFVWKQVAKKYLEK